MTDYESPDFPVDALQLLAGQLGLRPRKEPEPDDEPKRKGLHVPLEGSNPPAGNKPQNLRDITNAIFGNDPDRSTHAAQRIRRHRQSLCRP